MCFVSITRAAPVAAGVWVAAQELLGIVAMGSVFGSIKADEATDKTMVACKQVRASSYAMDTLGEAARQHAFNYSTSAASSAMETAKRLNPCSIVVVADHHLVILFHR